MSWVDDIVGAAGDIFGGAADWLGTDDNLGGVIEAGGALYNVFRDKKNVPATQMAQALGASIDPTSPKFRNLAALFEQKYKADALRGIREQYNQAARMKARGYTGQLINPERRDEARSGAIAQAFMGAGRQGRQEAGQALTGAVGQYQPLIDYSTGREQQRSANIGNLSGAAAGLADLFMNKEQPYQPFTPTPQQQQAMSTDYFDYGPSYSEFT